MKTFEIVSKILEIKSKFDEFGEDCLIKSLIVNSQSEKNRFIEVSFELGSYNAGIIQELFSAFGKNYKSQYDYDENGEIFVFTLTFPEIGLNAKFYDLLEKICNIFVEDYLICEDPNSSELIEYNRTVNKNNEVASSEFQIREYDEDLRNSLEYMLQKRKELCDMEISASPINPIESDYSK